MYFQWHLGFVSKEYTPLYRGFDSFMGFYNGAEDYYTHMKKGGLDLHRNEEVSLILLFVAYLYNKVV